MKIPAVISVRRGLSGEGSWRYIGIYESHRPLDGFDEHFLKPGIVPILLDVAKCGVVDTPFSVHFCPRYREIAILPVYARIIQIEFAGIEPHQNAELVPRIISHLIDFVL